MNGKTKQKETGMSKEVEWENVWLDKTGLVNAISESAWCAETKSKDQKLLYMEDGQVREEWASVFWSVHSAYSALVDSYIKNVENADNQEKSSDKPD